VALLGLADDLGVKLNNGRPGAADGPKAFRQALYKYGVAQPSGIQWPRVFDAGDVVPCEGSDAAALKETHDRVTLAVQSILDLGMLPVGIGGGHDLTFPFVRALAHGIKALEGVYFDAHLDVRDTPGSGMPFRSLIEQCGVSKLTLHGINHFVNSREHVEWFLSHGGSLSTQDQALADFKVRGPAFVSIDLDVLDSSMAPGVSAINPVGWTVRQLAEYAFLAGENPHVRCLDIMELNPNFDIDGRTARAAAHLFLSFLHGFSRRTE
jgi:formimidoylglutamase